MQAGRRRPHAHAEETTDGWLEANKIIRERQSLICFPMRARSRERET